MRTLPVNCIVRPLIVRQPMPRLVDDVVSVLWSIKHIFHVGDDGFVTLLRERMRGIAKRVCAAARGVQYMTKQSSDSYEFLHWGNPESRSGTFPSHTHLLHIRTAVGVRSIRSDACPPPIHVLGRLHCERRGGEECISEVWSGGDK
eukprot:gene10070-biopygen3463